MIDIKTLLNSKSIVMVLAVLGVIVMNVVGRIEGQAALDFIWKVVVAWSAAEAYEKGKIGAAEKTAAGVLIAAPEVTDNEKALAELKKAGSA